MTLGRKSRQMCLFWMIECGRGCNGGVLIHFFFTSGAFLFGELILLLVLIHQLW